VRRLPAPTVFYGLELLLAMPAFVVTAVYFVRVVDMSPLQLIVVGTVMEAAVFLFEVPTGAFADAYGRRLSIVVSLVLQGVATIVVGAVPSFWVIALAWGLWGFGYTFMSGAYEAWITDEVGTERISGVFLRGARLGSVGGLVGLAGSVGIALWSLQAAVIAGGVLTLACGLACLVVMPETGWSRRPREERGNAFTELARGAGAGARFVRMQPLLLLILAISLFAGASTESFDRLREAHFIRDVGLPAIGSLDPVVWFGIFAAGSSLLSIAASGVLIRRFELAGREVLARRLFALSAVQLASVVLFAVSGNIAPALAGYWIYYLTRSLINPVSITWLNQNISDSSVRATVISISGQSDAIGQVAGGPLLGGVGNVFGIRAALLAGGALLAPALALYTRAIRHGGAEPELEELPAAAEASA
jgi:DHA3 family tetracycline resistance protein-like MFS transporter